MRYHVTPIESLLSKRQEIASVGDVETRTPLCTVGGIINWYKATMGNNMEGPQKLKIDLSYDPAGSFLGTYL